MATTKRFSLLSGVFWGFACLAFGTVEVESAECSSGLQHENGDADVSLLQTQSGSTIGCNKKSLIIAPYDMDTYLQWNMQLMSEGAPFAELNIGDELNVELVQPCGKPAFGIVLMQIPSGWQAADSAKLLQYLEAGGLLVIADSSDSQTNAVLEALNSSIRQTDRPDDRTDVPCRPAEDPGYVPVKSSSWCAMSKLTEGATGLQGSNLDLVSDDADSSVALFAEKGDPDYVVARAEKKRRLIVIGDDEPVDDDCATYDNDMTLAFGATTNLRFFSNLYNNRCMKL